MEICTIFHPVRELEDKSYNRNRNEVPFCDLESNDLERSDESSIAITDSVINPLNYSCKSNDSSEGESAITEIKKSTAFEGHKNDSAINRREEICRSPMSNGVSGASGFGSTHGKISNDVLNFYLCRLCVHFCIKRAELKKHHTTVHLDGKPYACPHCPYRSTHKSTLRSHIMSRHTGERPFECPRCDYKASQKGLVDKHVMAKHTGEKPYKCTYCDFSSSHSSTVKTHVMFKHTGEKPYECPLCDYRAVQRGHIVRHIRSVHSGEKPFRCPHCAYKAGRSTNIEKHVMAVHTKEKPYLCPHCDFKSSHKGNLASHVVSKHTGTKPFCCQFCDYKSSCKTGLNKHLLKHGGVKRKQFRCHFCEYSSYRKDHLSTHVSFVHFKGNEASPSFDEMKTRDIVVSITDDVSIKKSIEIPYKLQLPSQTVDLNVLSSLDAPSPNGAD